MIDLRVNLELDASAMTGSSVGFHGAYRLGERRACRCDRWCGMARAARPLDL